MINNPSRSPTNRISWVSNSIPFVSQKAPVPSATSISDPLPHTLEKISGLLLCLCVPKNNMQGVDWKHNQDNHRNHYWLVHPLVGTPGGFRQKKNLNPPNDLHRYISFALPMSHVQCDTPHRLSSIPERQSNTFDPTRAWAHQSRDRILVHLHSSDEKRSSIDKRGHPVRPHLRQMYDGQRRKRSEA